VRKDSEKYVGEVVGDMINKEYGDFVLSCDICGHEVKPLDDFNEAIEYKKDNGWRSQKRNGEWEDVCPKCQNKR
jgi:hypothetical protein